MRTKQETSRRTFLAATTTAIGAARASGQSTDPAPEKLALEGGEKAVREPAAKLVRWGKPERERLESLIEQDSLFYWKGPQTRLLIERFQEACPLEHVMTCSSGTAALHIAVAAAGIGPGDEVITSPVTDIGTVIGVLYQQAVPVFADLLPGTYNLDPADVARKITPKTRAIIAVHLAGNPCDMAALASLAERHNLILIEDAAQAWGAKYDGRPIGTIGTIACFSLQNSKHVTCGDGGIVASSDPEIGPRLQRFGDKGMNRLGTDGLFSDFATNYRMSEPQAAIAAAQMGRLEEIASKRAILGNLLTQSLLDVPGISPHQVRSEDRCTYWFYMLRLAPDRLNCDAKGFARALNAEGATASAGYIPVPLYANPVFQNHGFFPGRWPIKELGLTSMDYTKVDCPEARAILDTGVRLVIHEAMTKPYIRDLAKAVRKVAVHYGRERG